MEKLLKKLHKKLDYKLENNKQFLKQKSLMEITFKKEGLSYQNKDAFDYYRNEIIFHGVYNKKMIEDAYFQGMVKMQDYFIHLDFNEKKRLMNYEIEECLKNLNCFQYGDTTIYIPFFDEKMNQIYKNEMVLFDLKQYHRIINKYTDLFHNNYYGLKTYASTFSSLEIIAQTENKTAMFDQQTKRLFFLDEDHLIDFITLKHDDKERLQRIALAFFCQNKRSLIDELLSSENIDDKLAKKLQKYIK